MENAIDLVIPMVFPDDPEWRKVYDSCHGGGDATRHVRFRSWGTEELLVRCVMKYMPWLRFIHILLAMPSQEQEWMKRWKTADGRCKIHFHREFMPEEYLPCFCSPCFEMFLHRIPGLSEHFIYANDDMFPLSPLVQEDFFRPDGKPPGTLLPCVRFRERPWPADPNIFHRKCRNQQDMIGAPFGRGGAVVWLKSSHSFAPILKSSCEEVWRRHGDEITRHLSPLSRTVHSYNHYIYMLHDFFSGRTVDYAPREQYAGKGTPTAQLADIIRDPQAGIVCLNDHESISDWMERARVVREEITGKLNIKL